MEGSSEEVEAKVARVRSYLRERGLAGVLINRQDNFAWLTGGKDNHVVDASDVGVAALLVTPDARFLLANRIEAGRLEDEEVGGQGWELRTFDWYRPGATAAAVRDVVGDRPLASDTPFGDARPLDHAFDELRADLLPPEVERYREVGRIATETMIGACQALHQGQTEWEIAADLGRRVRAHGGRPGVLLIATDERIARYRHPIPTDKRLREYAMLVLGASKWGLQVSITRFVAFQRLTDELRRKWLDVSRIAAYFNAATRPGRPWGEIFRGATELYAELGWPGEWELHHQGGPTGYRGRDFTATFDSPGVVSAHQAAAWNPSITGTKSEDTIIATDAGHEFLTRHGQWPMLRFEHAGEQVQYPDVLVRDQTIRRYA
ncbi:MAG TPA: M24 family metallopeptidase [Chloroflexota bacterium]|nr:M24 family metallopeptidase [Chloroflexota bacterium]